MFKPQIVTIFVLSWIISFYSTLAFCDNAGKVKTKALLLFSAPWCKYCEVAKHDINTDPLISEVIKQYEVVILDFDVDKEFVEGYNIKSIPAFIVLEDGLEVRRKIGYSGGSNSLYKFLK